MNLENVVDSGGQFYCPPIHVLSVNPDKDTDGEELQKRG
jgi:hypothetical protein